MKNENLLGALSKAAAGLRADKEMIRAEIGEVRELLQTLRETSAARAERAFWSGARVGIAFGWGIAIFLAWASR